MNLPVQASTLPATSPLNQAFGSDGREARCVFCVYEAGDRLNAKGSRVDLSSVAPATVTIQTTNGPRDVCMPHAHLGEWRRA